MRRLLIFLAITAVHFALNEGAILYGGGAIMADFDGKGSPLASLAGFFAMSILNFPLIYVLRVPDSFGTAGEYALLVLNSMLWGGAGVWLWSKLTGWRQRSEINSGERSH